MYNGVTDTKECQRVNMKKKSIAIIVAIIAVLAIVGVVVAINMNNNKDGDTNNTSQTNQASNNAADPAKEFNPKSPDSLSYVSTSKTTVSGQTVESTTENDGKGTAKTSSSYGGMTTESYVTGDTVITCVNGECTKTAVDPADKEAAAFAQNASQYKDSATNAGTEACPAGTCQVWKATGEAGDVTYYIDSENRISKIVLAQTGSETTFDYKDVTITVPTV